MTIDEFKKHCLAKLGTSSDFPFGPETLVMRVGGKICALTNVVPITMSGQPVGAFNSINLKCNPDRALMLRDTFQGVKPG